MRVVFMGTPQFAAIILDKLLASHIEVAAVVTRPDAVRARGKRLMASPVKQSALDAQVPLIETTSLKSPEVQDALAAYDVDIFVVAAYGALLPREILDMPRLGCLNVHASLLPRWRGAAPIHRALLAGDTHQGVCIMRMEEGLDTGDYCRVASFEVGDASADYITDTLANLGADELIDALMELQEMQATSLDVLAWTAQDETQVTYAHKIAKHEVRPDPQCSVADNIGRIRASDNTAPARCVICDKSVRITAARHLEPHHSVVMSPGTVSHAHRKLYLACADGIFEVLRLKPDGKNEQDAQAWMAGLRSPSMTWSALS